MKRKPKYTIEMTTAPSQKYSKEEAEILIDKARDIVVRELIIKKIDPEFYDRLKQK